MGIQINGQTDTISASDGGLAVSGYELTGPSNINVTGIITASQLNVGTGASIARFDDAGRLLVGVNSTSSISSLVVEGSSSVNHAIAYLARDNAPPSSTSLLGSLNWSANNHSPAAAIDCRRDAGTWTNGSSQPTRLEFTTTLDGTSLATSRMTILNTGQVNITPNNTLGLRIDSATSNETFIISANNSNFQIRHPAAGVEIFNSAGTAIRVVANTNGVSLASGAVAWTGISDERLKTDLENIEDGLNKAASLRAVTGRFISDEEGTRRSFLIAQDVEAVLPEAVDTSNPDELGLRYTEVIPLLVAALKESKERIETLEAKVAALEAQ